MYLKGTCTSTCICTCIIIKVKGTDFSPLSITCGRGYTLSSEDSVDRLSALSASPARSHDPSGCRGNELNDSLLSTKLKEKEK